MRVRLVSLAPDIAHLWNALAEQTGALIQIAKAVRPSGLDPRLHARLGNVLSEISDSHRQVTALLEQLDP